ncbi:MAG: type IV pilus modification PilV family protein [Pseudolysinimonas sp.]
MSIRQLSARLRDEQSGMGIVEIIVALMVFSVIAVGMSYSLIAMTRLTADSSARETAANLAAAEIDRLHSISDAFTIQEDDLVTRQVIVDGITYHIATNTSWVGANGSTGKCGIGGGQLQYKRLRVTVTWDNMYLDRPVRADSALAPSTRINDPTAGTILVSVTRESGDGQAGIAITATKTSGGLGLPEAPDPTDVDGCSYILKAPPGTYNLTTTKAGYINTAQQLLPVTQSIVVTAGAATPVALQQDLAQTYTLKFAANSSRTVRLPTNLDVTYFGQSAAGPLNETATGTRKLYPWAAGYQAIAGNPTTCAAVDPELWTETSSLNDGVRAAKVPATAGGSATLPAVMGVASVQVPGSSSSLYYITATAVSGTDPGNPGCDSAATTIYKFDRYAGGSTQTIALPYGVWKLTVGSSAGSTTTPITGGVTVLDGAVSLNSTGYPVTGVAGGGNFSSNLLTLDPRVAK